MGDSGRLNDGIPSVDLFGRVLVAVASWDSGGEGEVRGDLPEGEEGHPDGVEDIVSGWLVDPVRPVQNEIGAPLDDRVRWVHQVEHPVAFPRWVLRRDAAHVATGEADGATVLVHRLDLGAA